MTTWRRDRNNQCIELVVCGVGGEEEQSLKGAEVGNKEGEVGGKELSGREDLLGYSQPPLPPQW